MSNRQPQMPMVAVVLLTTSLLAVVMALGFSLHQTPTYEATVKMLVGPKGVQRIQTVGSSLGMSQAFTRTIFKILR